MTIRIDVKKLGNHWYPSINHHDPNDLSLDPKMERLLSKLDIDKEGKISIYLTEQSSIIQFKGIIQFLEEDIVKYLTTEEEFIMNLYIDNTHFYISSELYSLLEELFHLDFHKNLYKIELW